MTISGIHTRAPGSAHTKTVPVSPAPAAGKAHTNKQHSAAAHSPVHAEQSAKPTPVKTASAHRLDIAA